MALSGVTCPSCCLQDLGRRQGRECNHTSAVGSGIPGFDSPSVESCQADSCPDVFECSLAVSVWIISQQLCGMQSPPLEMTLCCFVFTTSSLLSAALYLNCSFCTVSLLFPRTYSLLLLLAPVKPALDNSSLCLLLSSGLLKGFARAPHDVHGIGEWRVLYWIIITEGPGTEQEMQVLFLHKHLQFVLAEYLDTNSLWIGIP